MKHNEKFQVKIIGLLCFYCSLSYSTLCHDSSDMEFSDKELHRSFSAEE